MSELRTYVEIDVDYDSLADPPQLVTPITYRFGLEAVDAIRADIEARHSIRSVSFNPGMISLGEDLGVRTSVAVTLKDDPSYDGPGTYWGRFRARHPYLTGRPFRLIQGLGDTPLAQMTTRHYVIDAGDGPKADATFTITAKDVFKLADGEKAQAPAASKGRLSADIDSTATGFTLEPLGIGDAEYPASGIVALSGSELCDFTRVGDAMTIVRGQYNTDAQDHKGDERAQLCVRYNGIDPANILQDLLVTYASIPASYIPLQEWLDETQNKLAQVYTGLIAEPTAVKDLVSELISQAGLAMWWDDIAQLLRLQVLAGLVAQPVPLDHSTIVENTFRVEEQAAKRLSQIWTYYGQRNALEGQEDPDNYRSLSVTVDTDAEANYGLPAIRKIYSRWIPEQGRAIAESLNLRLLARFKDPPRKFSFAIFRKSIFTPVPGEGWTLDWWTLQDANGAPAPALIELTRVAENQAVYQCQAEEVLYTAPPDVTERVVTIENDTFNVNLRSLHDQIYITPQDGDTVICVINAGVTVGSINTGLYAFDVGSWPVGVEIILQIRGRIQGMGGDGGQGSDFVISPPTGRGPQPGDPGGPALFTTYAIKVDADMGEIFGGAGGGGGGGNGAISGVYIPGGGGGGGAGALPGQGGLGGDQFSPGVPPGDPGTADAGGQGGQTESTSGGDGGGPGLAGMNGGGDFNRDGGAPGNAINGRSLITLGVYDAGTKTFTPGATGNEDIRGPEIN